MADIKSKEARSYNMSQIRSKDTKPEEKVRKYLFSCGFRYRKNDRKLPGCPDIVLPRYKTVIFVNGCFWHRHPGCKYATTPQNNYDFWQTKFEKNVLNDRKHADELLQAGLNIITVWECELKGQQFQNTMDMIVEELGRRRNQNDKLDVFSTKQEN